MQSLALMLGSRGFFICRKVKPKWLVDFRWSNGSVTIRRYSGRPTTFVRTSKYLVDVLNLLPPSNEVCQGYVFTGVCPRGAGGRCLCLGGSVQGKCLEMQLQWLSIFAGGLYPGGSLSRGVSVQGVSVWGIHVWRGVSIQGVSVQGKSLSGRPPVW